jgi:hypothetical protein
MSGSRRWIGASAVVAVVLAGAVAAQALGPVVTAGGPAVPARPAVRALAVTDVVSVSDTSDLDESTRAGAIAAASAAGGVGVEGRGFTAGMTQVLRGGAVVQQAPSGWRFPMGVTTLPIDAIGRVMSARVSATLAGGGVVMGRTSADLRGAQVGDTIDLLASDGSTRRFTIGLVADDAEVGGAELVMSPAQADWIGARTLSYVLIFGFRDRAAIDAALAAQGLTTRSLVRIRRSWDLASPDSTLGMARTKALLGEFAFTVSASGAMSVSTSWSSANIPPTRELLDPIIQIRAQCHRVIKPALQAALAEVAASGLAGAIDVANANTYGGCYYPRYNRLAGSLGTISRHSWGMALDTNTTSNPQGGVPLMNCNVVRIFRKHGFAWGGNFTMSDGMHFEWVGEPRDQLPYPSKYCPNLVPLPLEDSEIPVEATARPTFFAEDGWGHDG